MRPNSAKKHNNDQSALGENKLQQPDGNLKFKGSYMLHLHYHLWISMVYMLYASIYGKSIGVNDLSWTMGYIVYSCVLSGKLT